MRVLSLPAIYALELTPACNNRCRGCSNVYAAQRDSAPPMDAAAWRALLAPFIAEAVQIRLTGGEPTLHPGFFSILDEATAHDALVTIFTNGRWTDPEEFVCGVRARPNVSGLLVSLHGSEAASHEAFSGVPGSYAETLANIALAIDHGVTVALSMVITQYSWDRIDALVALGRELGVQQVVINRYLGRPLDGLAPTDEQTRAAIMRVQDLAQAGAVVKYGIGVPQCFVQNDSEGCLAGVAYCSIDPWGRLRPCAHSPTIVGSLHEAGLAELWHGPAMNAWRALMPAECVDCAAYAVCHGGCRAVQELTPDGRDPLRHAPLPRLTPVVQRCELPPLRRPHICARLRKEDFGYVLLGRGQVIPVRPEAEVVIAACTGERTLAQIVEELGQPALDLVADLWQAGIVDLLDEVPLVTL